MMSDERDLHNERARERTKEGPTGRLFRCAAGYHEAAIAAVAASEGVEGVGSERGAKGGLRVRRELKRLAETRVAKFDGAALCGDKAENGMQRAVSSGKTKNMHRAHKKKT